MSARPSRPWAHDGRHVRDLAVGVKARPLEAIGVELVLQIARHAGRPRAVGIAGHGVRGTRRPAGAGLGDDHFRRFGHRREDAEGGFGRRVGGAKPCVRIVELRVEQHAAEADAARLEAGHPHFIRVVEDLQMLRGADRQRPRAAVGRRVDSLDVLDRHGRTGEIADDNRVRGRRQPVGEAERDGVEAVQHGPEQPRADVGPRGVHVATTFDEEDLAAHLRRPIAVAVVLEGPVLAQAREQADALAGLAVEAGVQLEDDAEVVATGGHELVVLRGAPEPFVPGPQAGLVVVAVEAVVVDGQQLRLGGRVRSAAWRRAGRPQSSPCTPR